jgi:hypothetical protein
MLQRAARDQPTPRGTRTRLMANPSGMLWTAIARRCAHAMCSNDRNKRSCQGWHKRACPCLRSCRCLYSPSRREGGCSRKPLFSPPDRYAFTASVIMDEPIYRYTHRCPRNPDSLARTSFCQRTLAEWASCFHEHSRVNGFDRRYRLEQRVIVHPKRRGEQYNM